MGRYNEEEVKEILDEFSDIVEDVKAEAYTKADAELAEYIELIIKNGVDRTNHSDILTVLEGIINYSLYDERYAESLSPERIVQEVINARRDDLNLSAIPDYQTGDDYSDSVRTSDDIMRDDAIMGYEYMGDTVIRPGSKEQALDPARVLSDALDEADPNKKRR